MRCNGFQLSAPHRGLEDVGVERHADLDVATQVETESKIEAKLKAVCRILVSKRLVPAAFILDFTSVQPAPPYLEREQVGGLRVDAHGHLKRFAGGHPVARPYTHPHFSST